MGERGFQVVPWYHYLWVFFGMELLAVSIVIYYVTSVPVMPLTFVCMYG